MRRRILVCAAVLGLGLGLALLVAGVADARPVYQVTVEPDTLSSEIGGTLTVYGSGFISTTRARLVGVGMLNTTVASAGVLQAVVSPGVPAGTYELQVSTSGLFTETDSLDNALITILASTPVPQPTTRPEPTSPPPPGRPVLAIRNFSVSPVRPVVGREFVVIIEVYNTGSRGAENTMIGFPGGTFVPVGETGHLYGLLHINHTIVVTQVMRVPSGMASGSYPLQVDLSANDWEGNHYEFPESIAVEVIGVGHGRPQLVIESAHTVPDLLRPGDSFDLLIELANWGDRTATSVLVGTMSPDLALPAGGSNVAAVGSVGINNTALVTLPLVLADVTTAGRLNLNLSLEYSDYTGGGFSAQQSVGLEVETALEERPQLLIESYATEPSQVGPGDILTLTLDVRNVGGGDAHRFTLALGGCDGSALGVFAPLNSGNVQFVPEVAAGEVVVLDQQLVVNASATSGVYSLPVALSYDDDRGTRHEDSQLISLIVRRQPHLQIGFYQPVGPVMVGEPFPLPIEVTNVGRNLLNVSTLVVSSEQLSLEGGTIYLGPLDGGTAGSLEATAVAEQGGKLELLVTVNYLDEFEQPQVVIETLTVQVEEPEIRDDALPGGGVGDEGGEQEETFWDKVLRFVRGLFGVGS
ncbi:MAG: hypothetical protein MUQ10_03055 [Anaerolineae bacterium]|nr:hypothetical protein [Anaerolineae bacterium]